MVVIVSVLMFKTKVSLEREILDYQKRIHLLSEELSKAKGMKEKLAPTLSKAQVEKLTRQMRLINDIIMLDIFPWNLALNSLETTIPKGIALKALHISGIEKSLALKGQADSMGQISLFLRNLDNAKQFSKSTLVKFSVKPRAVDSNRNPTQDTVSFEIVCKLNREYLIAALNSEPMAGTNAK